MSLKIPSSKRTTESSGNAPKRVKTASAKRVSNRANETFLAIAKKLCKPNIYLSARNLTLQKYQEESAWQHANPTEKQITDEEQQAGHTALTYAAFYKITPLVKILLDQGVQPHRPFNSIPHPTLSTNGDRGQRLPIPLQSAIMHGDMESVNQLLDYGAKMEFTHNERFPIQLHYYPRIDFPPMSVLAYALGASSIRKFHPEAALNIPMVKHLLKQKAPMYRNDLMDAIETCSMQAINLLWDKDDKKNTELATEAFRHLIEVKKMDKELKIDLPLTTTIQFLIRILKRDDTHGHILSSFLKTDIKSPLLRDYLQAQL